MKLSLQIENFIKKGYSFFEATEIIAKSGFDAMDFSFVRNRYFDETSESEEFKRELAEIRKVAEEKGMSYNQAHAPFPSNTADKDFTDKRFVEIVRSMKHAAMLGIETIVVHPMKIVQEDATRKLERLFELNMDFYGRLKPYCEEYGIKVAVENMWEWKNFCGGRTMTHSACSTPKDMLRYLDALDRQWFVACLDIGHALLLKEEPDEFIRELGKERLKALHVHDVACGMFDTHTLPFHGGSGEWDEITAALGEIGYDGDFTYEAGNFLNPLPKELFPAACEYMGHMGRYLVEQIEMKKGE